MRPIDLVLAGTGTIASAGALGLVLARAPCLTAALAAPALVSLQTSVIDQLGAAGRADVAAAAALLRPIVIAGAAGLGAIALAAALLVGRVGRAEAAETWGCGYAAATPRMQYTGAAFAELVSSRLLPRWVRGRVRAQPPAGPFPASAHFVTDATDPFTRGAYEPLLTRWGNRFARLRFLQQGNVHIYIVYILAAAIVALAWVAAREVLAR